MKQILISAGILLVCLAFSLISLFVILDVCNQTSNLLEQSLSSASAEDFQVAEQTLRQAEQAWREKENFLGIVLRHDDMDEILTVFSELKQYAQVEDLDDYRANCAKLLAAIDHVRQTEKPKLPNIL